MVRKRGATAQKRDYSMLYGVLGGFGLFVLLPLLVALYFIWPSYMYSKAHPFFPEGTQVTQTDDHGFPGDGTATVTAHIPPDASKEFAQKLREDGFQETPLSDFVQRQLQGITEAEAAAQVTNGLWYFQDDTPEEFRSEYCRDYTFEIYDLDACVYYSIESDS